LARVLGVYTERTQGYRSIHDYMPTRVARREVGDKDKAAARIFDVVRGAGVAREVAGRTEWLRVPLGMDCGQRMRAKLRLVSENVEAYEPVWSSTEMDERQFEEVKKAVESIQ